MDLMEHCPEMCVCGAKLRDLKMDMSRDGRMRVSRWCDQCSLQWDYDCQANGEYSIQSSHRVKGFTH